MEEIELEDGDKHAELDDVIDGDVAMTAGAGAVTENGTVDVATVATGVDVEAKVDVDVDVDVAIVPMDVNAAAIGMRRGESLGDAYMGRYVPVPVPVPMLLRGDDFIGEGVKLKPVESSGEGGCAGGGMDVVEELEERVEIEIEPEPEPDAVDRRTSDSAATTTATATVTQSTSQHENISTT